ncbi:MAG TPA: response regulator, partial [Chloroflexi bacterium]|nr:response regulator [Chloroflexota bacterium]
MTQSHTIRVLIVEDDFLVGETVRGVLEDFGYQIIGRAMNGIQATEMTQALRPDVILMDLQMPDMDGIEATRRIQKSSPTPVVALTAYDTPELVEEASKAGVGAYLLKPPNGKELERAITIALARFDDMVELRRLNAELQDALEQVQTLSGLLPICSSCK